MPVSNTSGAGSDSVFYFSNLPEDGILYAYENTADVFDIDVEDPEGSRTTYQIVGGADAGLFRIDPNTGLISFIDAPDYETPLSADGDNSYDVVVRLLSDTGETIERTLTIDASEPAPQPAPALGSISGHYFIDSNNNGVDDDGASVTNAVVQLWRKVDGTWTAVQQVTTDADGNYTFTGLEADPDYRVRFINTTGQTFTTANAGSNDSVDSDVTQTWTSTGQTAAISLAEGQVITDVDAGVKGGPAGSISGRFFADDNDNAIDDHDAGVGGVTVQLVQKVGGVWTAVRETTTAADGSYYFTGLAADPDYRVRFVQDTGLTFVASNRGDDFSDSDVVQVWGAARSGRPARSACRRASRSGMWTRASTPAISR